MGIINKFQHQYKGSTPYGQGAGTPLAAVLAVVRHACRCPAAMGCSSSAPALVPQEGGDVPLMTTAMSKDVDLALSSVDPAEAEQ